MQEKKVDRETVLERLLELAAGKANDAVKLAYLTEERDIDKLSLGCLTEFKRNGNGTVEVKLTDRAAVLEKLLEHLEEGERGAEAFLAALDGPEENRGPEGVSSAR